MEVPVPEDHALVKLFRGVTEQTFLGDLGVADPPLIDYVSGLLVRFLHVDRWPGQEFVELVLAADAEAEARVRRERHRELGDWALFAQGLCPQAAKASATTAVLGRHAYRVASRFTEEPFGDEAPVLHRLSCEFDLCAEGLRLVNRDFQQFGRLPGTQIITG